MKVQMSGDPRSRRFAQVRSKIHAVGIVGPLKRPNGRTSRSPESV